VTQRFRRGALDAGIVAYGVPGRLDALRVSLEVRGSSRHAILLGDRNPIFDELSLDPLDPRPDSLRDRDYRAALAGMHPSRLAWADEVALEVNIPVSQF